MVLADKIMRLRKRQGWSQEELASRLNVSRQSVSKWESAMSVPELDKILMLSQLFGVTTDYLLKDELETDSFLNMEDVAPVEEDSNPQPAAEEAPWNAMAGDAAERAVSRGSLTVWEANQFMENRRQCAPMIAWGVAACVFSPVPLMVLNGLFEVGYGYSEGMSTGLGVAGLLLIVAAAVALFIYAGLRMEKYDYIEKKRFIPQPGVREAAMARKLEYKGEFVQGIVAGVALCILSPIPIIIMDTMGGGEGYTTLGAGILLVLVAMGTFYFTRCGIVMESFDRLLKFKGNAGGKDDKF